MEKFENFIRSDDKNADLYKARALHRFLRPVCENLDCWSSRESKNESSENNSDCKLTSIQHLILVLLRLRMGYLIEDLAIIYRFDISTGIQSKKMKTIMIHPILEITQEQIKEAKNICNMNDDQKIQECIDAVEEWLNKQDHLAEALKYLNRYVIERFMFMSKGSVEATKTKIDKCFTLRGLTPEICQNRRFEEYENFSQHLLYVTLPKMCKKDLSRITVTQPTTAGWGGVNILSLYRTMSMLGEYRLYHDYCISERYIFDFRGMNINILTKLNPLLMKKAEILVTEGYGMKIKGIHILNAPKFVDRIVFIIKQGLREKVASRVHVHNTYEDLHEHISKVILPKDYGGDGPSCRELYDQWRDCLSSEEGREIIDKRNRLVSDESKRCEMKFNEEYLGMPGSFRKLTTD